MDFDRALQLLCDAAEQAGNEAEERQARICVQQNFNRTIPPSFLDLTEVEWNRAVRETIDAWTDELSTAAMQIDKCERRLRDLLWKKAEEVAKAGSRKAKSPVRRVQKIDLLDRLYWALLQPDALSAAMKACLTDPSSSHERNNAVARTTAIFLDLAQRESRAPTLSRVANEAELDRSTVRDHLEAFSRYVG